MDAIGRQQVSTADIAPLKRVSWAAIFAGALAALGVQLLLALLGLGIGMSTVDPQREQNPLEGLGAGALIWWAISFLLSLFLGGWIAGRLSGSAFRFNSYLHGGLTWVVFVLFNLYLMTSAAGSVLRSAGGVLGSTVSLAGRGAMENLPQIREQIQEGGYSTALDSAQIRARVEQLQRRAPEAEAKARQMGDDVAEGLSRAGLYSFVGLLLGAGISMFGAGMGRKSEEDAGTERVKN